MKTIYKALTALSLVAMMSTACANANISLNKGEYRFTPPKDIKNLCKAVIKERIAEYKKEGLELDELDTDPKTACVNVRIDIPKTGVTWMDTILNKQSSLSSFQEEIPDVVSDLRKEFANPKNAPSSSYTHIDTLSHISTSDVIAQFTRDFYVYNFGTHSYSNKNIYALDLQDKKHLTINDILTTPAKKSVLFALVKRHFINYLKGSDVVKSPAFTDDEVREHFQDWAFYVVNNFAFTPDGITFWYATNEIAPYIMGDVILSVPKSELKGIIKDKYLNQKFTHFDRPTLEKEW